ncbi:zinc-dependent metalloprotease [soil metagenome]
MPFFGDLAKMLGQQGPLSWDAARHLAVSIAAGGESEPNVDPLERIKLEQLARVAELQVANATGLSTSTTGRGVRVVPVTRAVWVQRTLDAYRPLFERLAAALAEQGDADGDPLTGQAGSAGDPAAWLGGLMKMVAPMMLGMTAGSLVGHLGTRALGQYDLPIPRPADDELAVVHANLSAFGDEWSLPEDDLALWVCIHEIAHHAVLGVPHVRSRLEALLFEYVSGFEPESNALEQRMGELDPTDAESLQGFQQLLGDPETLLGALQSPAQRELLPRLEALVAVVVGYVDHVMDRIGEHLIPSYAMVTEALRRRRVEAAPSDRFVERLLGLDLTQEHYERGASFFDGVAERAGEDALARLWEAERLLPTPAEIDAPGLWLARLEFDTDG